MMCRLVVLCGALVATAAASAAGQQPVAASGASASQAQSPVSREPATVTVGWEFRNDAHRYRFENASSFDTPTLVPHFFEQAYDTGNRWLVANARYGALGGRLETEVAVAFKDTGIGDDYDTFFQPSGDTVVYGTTAVTSVDAFRISQRATIGTAFGFTGWVGYVYRRDRSEFRPSDTITRHTTPPSESRFFNTDRETTISAVQEAQLGVTRTIVNGRHWRLVTAVSISPVTLARLTTILPDKYPGQDIVFLAKGLSLAPSLRLSVTRGIVAAGFSADYVHTWPYGSTSRFTRDWFSVGAFVGWSARR